jgi:hypothetical protein
MAGLQMLRNLAEWTFVDARGYMPEVVSGEFLRPLDTSVPHQLFSSFGYAVGVIRGLMGLEPSLPVGQLAGSPVNSLTGKPANRPTDQPAHPPTGEPLLLFAPHFPPDWEEVRVKNIRVGKSVFDLQYQRNLGGITLNVERAEGPVCKINFAPQLEAGADVAQTSSLLLKTEKNAKLQIPIFEGTWIELPREPLQIGQRSQQLRVLSERLEDNRFVFVCEGAGGRSYEVIVHSPRQVASVDGGELILSDKTDIIRLKFLHNLGEYERREVIVNLEE